MKPADRFNTDMQHSLDMIEVRERCQGDPKALLEHMSGFDPTLQESFSFNMSDAHGPWGWQALVVDWWMGTLSPDDEVDLHEFLGWWEGYDPTIRKFIILKARQLGITWLAVAVGVWYLLYRPGSNVVCYSHGQEEAKLLVGRAWLMYQSIPLALRDHVEVVFPIKAEIPSERIVLKHPGGELSIFKALPDTQKAGHGETITFGIMDEVARMQYARGIYTAINPALSRGGRLVMISTANGVSNAETGAGNFFHNLWATRQAKGLSSAFLPWSLHPERDQEWYDREAMALPHMERNQQYPLNPDNAFILSGDLYFDPDALAFYRGHQRRSMYRGQFRIEPGKGTFVKVGGGLIEVYEPPRAGGRYGISADTASGRSQDYSSSDVVDLTSGDIVASLRSKIEIPAFANQLKCLGRWYAGPDGTPARLIPERTGIGEALIVALRSNADGLKPYGNLYQHTRKDHLDRPIGQALGFPMQAGTRGMVLERLRGWIKQRRFPYLSPGHVDELSTFIYRDTKPTPRAMDGCNDDRVISLALAVHLFDEVGDAPTDPMRKKRWHRQQYEGHPSRSDYVAPRDDPETTIEFERMHA